MNNTKVTRLQTYLDHVQSMVKSLQPSPKREFFEREVRKTLHKINELTK